ncbi:MAG TPA: hypothetical protein VJZ00_07545 [Thermoanaerobaculia bacterium]|nr:hypothetical protein [Thermoanaerobaculia bacterium]
MPPLAGDAGRRVYERFRTLLDLLLPDFASITIEEPLQCPADLQQDPRSLAFRDFYVSATTIDCRRITKLFHEAYCEEVAAGVYVSTTRWFNPRAHALDRETAQFLSVEVAKWIAQT